MKSVLVVVLSLVVLCTACSTAWVSTLDSILAAAAPALVNILQIVAVANGQPVNSNLEAKINADAAVIKTLAGDFAKASSSAAPTVCSQLQAAISTYQADQQLVLSAAQVSDLNTQTKITLLAGLVAGTVQSIGQTFKAAPPYGLSTFVTHYNSILVAPTGNKAVDAATRKLQVHQHSKIVREVTFGWLN
jgi:hypothetical protein